MTAETAVFQIIAHFLDALSGIVGVIETVRGWCVLRACKIKTRF